MTGGWNDVVRGRRWLDVLGLIRESTLLSGFGEERCYFANMSSGFPDMQVGCPHPESLVCRDDAVAQVTRGRMAYSPPS